MLKKLLTVALVLGGMMYALHTQAYRYRIFVPEFKRPPKPILLEQNWTAEQRAAFHHTAQGTRLVPWAWFKALEQPCLSLSGCDPLSNPNYLLRFGFIPSTESPDGLPVGFAIQEKFHDPISNSTYPVVGFTCAACHTGELFYGDYAIRIEGGPGLSDLGTFQKALGLSLAFTDFFPGRYGRFEKRVLGENATAEVKAVLKKDFDAFLAAALREKDYVQEHKIYDNPAGFGRTDALTRIGNQVFAVDLDIFDNFAASNAAVRFPQIWDAPWFNWVQYNSSIADPLVRNIGEALGVRALFTPENLDNSVDVAALNELETLLAGAGPSQGLRSPRWPEVFPPLDGEKVKKGEALYRKHCIGCHLPPPAELAADRQSAEPKYWEKTSTGVLFLRVTDVNIQRIGTDPRAALDFRNRTANSGALKKGRLTAAEGLDTVTRAIANRYFDQNGFPETKRLMWSGYRAPGVAAVRDKLIYKARPLNGIWAAAPFLHNGSVPSLYLMLSPPEERPAKFWTGTKQFDPVAVGYKTDEIEHGFLYDTAVPGNSNRGHEFNDGPKGNGVIGPRLQPDERWALVEFLKSL
ncbi:MAG: hypothetical protein HYX27_22230 [Acidobacteria bacterium]|nr:hypothetical protein [Acidobacteriota bacterium]